MAYAADHHTRGDGRHGTPEICRRSFAAAARTALAACLALIAFLAGFPATAQIADDGTVLLDRIVAVVNEGVVLESELEEEVRRIGERLAEQGTMLPPRDIFEAQVLERLVVRRIQIQRAERYGVRIDDESLNRALTAVAERNNIGFDRLPQALAEQGIDYAAYREELR